MTHKTKRIVIADPRTFDGDPYEVAERAVLQAQGVVELLSECLASARLMVRNAELSRQIDLGGDPDAQAFEESAQGRRWEELEVSAGTLNSTLGVLAKTASYNPKKPRVG
jgi:hypothetical protein